jgi:hypothetical protein
LGFFFLPLFPYDCVLAQRVCRKKSHGKVAVDNDMMDFVGLTGTSRFIQTDGGTINLGALL